MIWSPLIAERAGPHIKAAYEHAKESLLIYDIDDDELPPALFPYIRLTGDAAILEAEEFAIRVSGGFYD